MCLELMNVRHEHRAGTIQPVAFIPNVKDHIDMHLQGVDVAISKSSIKDTVKKTICELWLAIMKPLHDATHPNAGVRLCHGYVLLTAKQPDSIQVLVGSQRGLG